MSHARVDPFLKNRAQGRRFVSYPGSFRIDRTTQQRQFRVQTQTDAVLALFVLDQFDGDAGLLASGLEQTAILDRDHLVLDRVELKRGGSASEREHMSREGTESDVRLGTHSSREVGAGTPLPWNERALDGTARPTRSVCGVPVPSGTIEDE
jgi:hypothetical protein